jgi:hypothetical protein
MTKNNTLSNPILQTITLLLAITSSVIFRKNDNIQGVFVGAEDRNNDTQRRSTATATGQTVNDGFLLIDWIRKNGGYIDDRLIVRHKDPDDPTSYRGLFTTQNIEEDEDLCFVPWNTIITAGKDDYHQEDGGSSSQYDATIVDTAFRLVHEMNQGNNSHYVPYINLLRTQSISSPSSWSLAGREYFESIIENMFPKRRYYYFFERFVTQFGGLDSELMKAFLTVTTRAMQGNVGSQWLLVPMLDLQNHHSDKRLVNTARFAETGVGFEIRSTKFIPAGSELYTHYWGDYTNFFFEEFGFVEEYPQRWRFELQLTEEYFSDIDKSGTTTVIDVRINRGGNDDKSTTEDFHLEWLSDVPPNKKSFPANFLRDELRRLLKMEREYFEHGNNVPEEENLLIWKYHKAIVVAIKQILLEFSKNEDSKQMGEGEGVKEVHMEGINGNDHDASCVNLPHLSQ